MKKITALLLIALLGLSMAACGAAEPAPAKEEAPQQAAEPEKAPEAEPPAAEAPAEEAETAALTGEAQEVGEVLSTEEIIARVVEMQGQPVEELIDWLGQPGLRQQLQHRGRPGRPARLRRFHRLHNRVAGRLRDRRLLRGELNRKAALKDSGRLFCLLAKHQKQKNGGRVL